MFATRQNRYLASDMKRKTAPEQTRKPDARPPAEARGYDKDWYRVRWLILSRRPSCAICGASYEKGFHVDHIRKFSGKFDPLRLDLNNLQALCHSCHSRKTCQQDGGFGNPLCQVDDQEHPRT